MWGEGGLWREGGLGGAAGIVGFDEIGAAGGLKIYMGLDLGKVCGLVQLVCKED